MINAKRFLSPVMMWNLTTAQRDALSDVFESMEIYNTDEQEKQIYDGSSWASVGGGGGVGGFPLALYPGNDAGGAPPSQITSNLRNFRFEPSTANVLRAAIKVPNGYKAGDQIFLRSHFFANTSVGNGLFSATTYLVRVGTDTVGSATNSHASTNTAVTSSAGRLEQAIMDLTDSSGEINSVAVSPNDMLQIVISRGSDTNTNYLGLLEDSSEVILG